MWRFWFAVGGFKMNYVSTRGASPAIGFLDAVLAGLAPDGGLYVPEVWPSFTPQEIARFSGMAYAEVAAQVLGRFAGDEIPSDVLAKMTAEAYASFAHPAVTPLTQLYPSVWQMELFHGPTLAFKDVAMQLLARLYDYALAAQGRTMTIIAATSGDTGGAAVEAFRGARHARMAVLFPDGRISEVQRRFMTTTGDANVRAVAVQGTFDDCQTIVKAMFQDDDFRQAVDLSGVNSINWARIAAQSVYYFTAAAALGAPAPAPPLIPLPSVRPRFSALHRSRLWLDGGENEATTLFYSESGLIEQFAADAFITLSSEGGPITGLFPLYQNLLVFREKSIDIVQQNADGSFSVSTLSSSVTCRSPHSIAAVPGLGVVFLAIDGVYAVTGGLEGGAVSELVNVGAQIEGLLERVTPDCAAKAWANFSAATREYLLHVPTDGSDRPELGLVLHVDRLATQQAGLSPWTTREGFPVGCLATLYDGTVIFGHHTGAQTGGSVSQRGLFVISGKRALGKAYVDNVLEYTAPPTSIWRSAWMAFGDAQYQKQVQSVVLWVLTTGAPKITMRHYKDFSLTPIIERTYVAQPPDAKPLPELDKAVLGASATTFQDARLVPLRFSVAHQGAAWWAFGFETTDDLVLVGFEVDFAQAATKVIQGVRG